MPIKRIHAAKYWLKNYHCGKCETGVVQIHEQWKRGGVVTIVVSGCMDCNYEYGLRQAQELEEYKGNDVRWP